MKVSDYIVQYLAGYGVRHFFGYQGTMIAHFVDSIEKNTDVQNHSCYNEQGAAFAACGYAQRSNNLAVAYATSGPGAINLLSGVANAYYDSLPVLFLTGQLNTYEYTDIKELRQQGFQETDVVSMAESVTKWCVQIRNAKDIPAVLEKACRICLEGRRGPVLLDIPMNVQREDIPEEIINEYKKYPGKQNSSDDTAVQAACYITRALKEAKRPVVMMGNGIYDEDTKNGLLAICQAHKIPVITSILNLLDADNPCSMGHIGSAYGHRWANIIADTKADLIIAVGISLCPRQVGFEADCFAKKAKIIRIDIDPAVLKRKVHSDETEVSFLSDSKEVIPVLAREIEKEDIPVFSKWLDVCIEIKESLAAGDRESDWYLPNKICEILSKTALNICSSVAGDVGQHMMWISQSFRKRKGQQLLFSGGHGAMGYSLPAAIGACYATGKPSACICGDGSGQMNIQELQWVAREQLPICIIVMNNQALGLIHQQQGDFFGGIYAGAIPEFGFSSCNFASVARAYGIAGKSMSAQKFVQSGGFEYDGKAPFLLEITFDEVTKAYPKTYFGERMDNQRPYAPAELLEHINKL